LEHVSSANNHLRERVRNWAIQNLADPADYDKIDLAVEIDAGLSFDENVRSLQEKFPGAFRSEEERRIAPKQLIMPGWLIAKVENREKACTFRPKALNIGDSYYLVPNRFQGQSKARVVVRIVEVEKIEDPQELTDEEARWTGLADKNELFSWFKKWYAKRYPPDGVSAIKFRNWFYVEQSGEIN
jgi:hypothetical protein